MHHFEVLFANLTASAALFLVLLQEAPPSPVVDSSGGWAGVATAYLPVLLILATSVATYLESKRTTKKVNVVEKTVRNVELQGNSMLMAHLKNTARLLKLLSDDHPENAALQSEYKAALHDIEIHAKNQAVIDDRKLQGAQPE